MSDRVVTCQYSPNPHPINDDCVSARPAMTIYCRVGGRECPGHTSTSLVCPGQPLSRALGTLVVHEIRLRSVIAEAPSHIAVDVDGVTDEWLRSRWTCQNNPPCEES